MGYQKGVSLREIYFFFLQDCGRQRKGGVGITYICSCGGTFNGTLAFDSLDLLRFVVDDGLNFRLVDRVFALRDMHCTV